MFKRRGVEIFAPELDKVFDSNEFQTVLFRDSNLKSGNKIILREPAKQNLADNGDVIIDSEEESDGAEGGEDEMMEEGGEEELDEMAEEGEMEVEEPEGDDAAAAGAEDKDEGKAGDDKPNPDAEEHKAEAP